MKETKERKNQTGNEPGKSLIRVNIFVFAGMLCGGVLGLFFGSIFDNMPLYTGFGMILGMALVFDLTAHRKDPSDHMVENENTDR
ncbi:MAG: hypothetical protein IJ711_05665 [Lachnospiraceae bacterium]|nr:hypothetical protein [Lachnospiraceae bacterium]